MTGLPKVPPNCASDAAYAAGSDPWSGGPTKAAPSGTLLSKGYIPGREPSAQEMNYYLNALIENTKYGRLTPILNWRRSALSNVLTDTDFQVAAWCPGAGYTGAGAWVFASWDSDTCLLEQVDNGVGALSMPAGGGSTITSFRAIAAGGNRVIACGPGGGFQVIVWTNPGVADANLTGVVASFTGATQEPDLLVYTGATNDNFLGFASGNEWFRSNTAGTTWTKFAAPVGFGSAASPASVALGKVAGVETISVLSFGGKTVQSSDGGLTWSAAYTHPVQLVGITYNEADSEWLAIDFNGVIYSSADAQTWVVRWTPPASFTPLGSHCLKADGNRVIILDDRSIYVSADAGRTWMQVNTRDQAADNSNLAVGGGQFVRLLDGAVGSRSVYYSLRAL